MMKSILYSVLLLLLCGRGEARPIGQPPVAELTFNASHVVIIEPESFKQTKDIPDDDSFAEKTMTNYIPMETTFRVHGVLKGELNAEILQIVHFQYASKVDFNGSRMMTFFFSPAKLLTVPAGKDGKTIEAQPYNHAYAEGSPQYLAFLRRLPDGRFAPVTPQYTSALSFKVLTSPIDVENFRAHPAAKPAATPDGKKDDSSK